MKKLTNVVANVVNGKLTITADVVEADKSEYRFPIQRVTVGYLNPDNLKWPRHIQLSGEAFFVKAYGAAMVISHDDIVKIAAAAEPKTSFAPVLKQSNDLNGENISELPVSYQWQVSENGTDWTDIPTGINAVLDSTNLIKGQLVRLVATNAAGSTVSIPIQIK